jgi:hypothetical protein
MHLQLKPTYLEKPAWLLKARITQKKKWINPFLRQLNIEELLDCNLPEFSERPYPAFLAGYSQR